MTVRAKTDIIYVMLLRAGGFGAAFMQWQQGKHAGVVEWQTRWS